jgi:uracil-DNA glycosylase
MDSARRKQVFDALGIETWSQRTRQVSPQPLQVAAPVHASTITVEAAPASNQNVAMPDKFQAAPAAAFEVPTDWEGLRPAVAGCMRCKLCKTRTNTVFGVGLQSAPLMVVGEGPGADEDAQGEPFVGRAGKLLDEMLRAIGRSRKENAAEKSVFIANVVKCRPPGNRDPEPDEVEACRPYLDQQIRLVKPKLIVALGRVAAQRLLGTDAPLSKLRGPVHEYGSEHTPLLITYHPAYLLRSPGEKVKSWADLKRVHQLLNT